NGRTPAIGFLKPFGCHVMILNTLDHLEKFEAKGDEGYFIGYFMSSKAFRVFNKRTKRVKQNLHVEFLENKAIEKGTGPNWLFDIDSLTKSMNYVPVVVADNCNSDKPESSGNSNTTSTLTNPPADQLETLTVETTVPTISSPVLTACLNNSPEPSSDTRLISKRVAHQVETPSLDKILTLTNWFEDILGVTTNSDESNGVEADVSNMETTITASPTSTLRIHKDHPKSQIISPVDTPIQTRHKSKEAPRAWYGTLSKYLLTNGFQKGTIDQTLFIRRQREDFILVQVYVDDIIFGSSNPQLCREFKALMHEKFQMSAMDIMFAVCAYARHQVTPKECHLHAVKKIFRYLKGHSKVGIWYPKESLFDLVAYSDSDYRGATQDRKSTNGGCQFLAASCCGQVMWIQNQLLDYGLSMPCEALSMEISSSILLLCIIIEERFHIAKTFDLVWIWLGGDYGNVFLMGFNGIQWIETTEEGTKILATVDGKLRTVSESSIRRNLKLNDEAGINQDRANIAKTSTLPSDSTPRVISLAADEGNDAPIKGRRLDEGEEAAKRVSDDTEEMATVLTSMDEASILTRGGVQVVSTAAEVATVTVSIL
nr:hypothetical protein [Tanacetum cinerariifolium]